MTCASFDAAMHNQKSRNKFHSPILDIQSNKLAILRGQQIAVTSLFCTRLFIES